MVLTSQDDGDAKVGQERAGDLKSANGTLWVLAGTTPAASLMTRRAKNLPAMQETQEMRARSLDWEDPLEEEMAAHCSILV